MPEHVTILDVAREAGVSFKTVSNVLNNTGSMKESTRRRVEKAIDKLGYVVNASARSLRNGTTGLIGLSIFNFSQPFAPYLADQIIAYAKQRGYGTIINTYGNETPDGLEISMGKISQLAADGWIVFVDHPLVDEGRILSQPYPLVMVGDYNAYGVVDQVTMPNIESMQYVTGKLLDDGYRKIALFGAVPKDISPETYLKASEGTKSLRIQGYLRAFLERGIEPDEELIFPTGLMMSEAGIQAARKMLGRGLIPDAVICLNDAMALGTLHELQLHRISVPDEVQLIGFDNVPESKFSNPAITTIDPHIQDYARHAVDMLIDRIHGDKRPARIYTSEFDLIQRETTCLRA